MRSVFSGTSYFVKYELLVKIPESFIINFGWFFWFFFQLWRLIRRQFQIIYKAKSKGEKTIL